MRAAQPLPSKPARVWAALLADRYVRLAFVVGWSPILAGLIFRTYGYHVSPGWAEGLRQFDFPFVIMEVAVILWARARGMAYGALIARLDKPARIALAVLLCTFWLSSAFISADPAYSIVRASFWIIHLGFGCAVFHLATAPTVADLRRTGTIIFAGFLAFLPLTAVHLWAVPDPSLVREGKIIWSSAIPGSLSVRHLGIWSALVLACAIGALYDRDTPQGRRVFLGAMIFATTATLFWSGTRAGVYGMAGAFVVLLAFQRTMPPVKTLPMAIAAMGAGILVSEIWLPPDPAFGIFNRAQYQGAGLDGISGGRTILWTAMMEAFAGSPLFGLGEGSVLWQAMIGTERHVQPHNSLVQMLSSWGIVATCAAGYLAVRLMLLAHRLARRQTALVGLVLMLDCLLIMSLADGVLYFSRFIMWFAAGGALVLAFAARQSDAGPILSGGHAH